MTRVLLAGLAVLVLVATGCGATGRPPPPPAPSESFATTLHAARGQTVRWWMYGGDTRTNHYVDAYVKPAAAKLGVTLQRVPVTDTGEAVDRVVAERRAGRRSGGGVDLIWINGENFAAGKGPGLWLTDWTRSLPNARYVDFDAPLIARDFGVAVDGQEAPWSGAGFVFAYDRAKLAQPPTTFAALLAYARAHPGRVAYPAPPDYTGSAFVRQVIQRFGSEERGLAYLEELKPYTYRHGRSYPTSEQELDELFANGQVDFAMSYNTNFVDLAVEMHQFPTTTRPFLIGGGALQNTSYVTIPANAAHIAGAKVVVNLLLSPRLQAIKQDPDVLGVPTVLSPARLSRSDRVQLARASDPYQLASLGRPLAELPASAVAPIEQAWTRRVLR